MIRYEYEEEDMLFPDHKMPIVRSTEMHPAQQHSMSSESSSYFPEADWLNLNSDTPVGRQIDDFAQVTFDVKILRNLK